MVTLEIGTIYSKLIVHDPDNTAVQELWEYLDELLSYEIQNSYFIQANSNNRFIRDCWDGRSHLFNVKSGQFMTGHLAYVIPALQQFQVSYTVVDNRVTYTKGTTIPCKNLEIREYQREAVDTLIANKRGIVWASPRSGKTIMEIIMASEVSLFPVLSICQSLDIAQQTVAKFRQFLPGVKVGMVGDGQCDIQDVTVATIQSIMAAYNIVENIPKKQREKLIQGSDKQRLCTLVESAKVVWVDEAHHATSTTYKTILQSKIVSAEYILGCSGTPYREDNTNKLLEGLIGPIIYEITYSRLIDEGFLVLPTIHFIDVPKTIHFDDSAAYQTIYKDAIIDNPIRNDIITRIALGLVNKGKSCLILVNKISHGKALMNMMPFASFSYSKTADRENLWHQLKVKKIKCLITTLGDEGIDIPSLDSTIIASGGESAIKAFQRLRCMTPYPGKTSAIVVDFMDPYKYLKQHSKKRLRLYRTEPRFRVVRRVSKHAAKVNNVNISNP